MKKFDSKKTKYILNYNTGTLHYYNTEGCYDSRVFNINNSNLKFYDSEDEVARNNQTHYRKCKKCFKEK